MGGGGVGRGGGEPCPNILQLFGSSLHTGLHQTGQTEEGGEEVKDKHTKPIGIKLKHKIISNSNQSGVSKTSQIRLQPAGWRIESEEEEEGGRSELSVGGKR